MSTSIETVETIGTAAVWLAWGTGAGVALAVLGAMTEAVLPGTMDTLGSGLWWLLSGLALVMWWLVTRAPRFAVGLVVTYGHVGKGKHTRRRSETQYGRDKRSRVVILSQGVR